MARLLLPNTADDELRPLAKTISEVFGWLYFLAWSISFYPQPVLNYQRRTTQGLLPDFPVLNVIGFTCYTVSAIVFLYSPVIRQQYADRHPLSPEPTVRLNDLAFGLHALILCFVVYSQFWPKLWGWKPVKNVKRHAHKVTLSLMWGGIASIVATAAIVLMRSNDGYGMDASGWAWIDVIYSLTYVKLLLTVFKYVPQVIANFRRKSTIGWSITQQLLDLTGGILSLLQLIIDSALQADWSGLTGNPVKLGLANISLIFDILFIVQHFVLYGPVREKKGGRGVTRHHTYGQKGEREPLLPTTGEAQADERR